MSRIAIVVQDVLGPRKPDAIARLRAHTGLGIAALDQRLRNGQPVVVELLFRNDHGEVASRLRSMVRDLPLLGAKLRLFELSEDGGEPTPDQEITADVLLNILDSHDEGLRRGQNP